MMRKGSFGGLLFREWYMAKKRVFLYLVIIAGIFALCFMALLSFEYGNLALLDEKIKDAVYNQIVPIIKLYPVIGAGMLCTAVAESTIFDEKKLWKYFSKSTPVSCFRMAGAKYTLLIACAAIGLLLAFGFILGMNLLMKTQIEDDIPLCLTFYAVIIFMSVVFQLGGQITGSADKAGLIMAATLIAGVVAFAGYIKTKNVPQDATIVDRITMLLPDYSTCVILSAAVIVGALAVGYVCSAMLYKRREK